MINPEDVIIIGKFQKTHALKGELNFISNIDPEYFLEGNPLIIEYDGILVPYYVNSIRPKGSTSYLVKIDGIDSEEEANQFVNKEIWILKRDAETWLEDELIDSNELKNYKILDSQSGKEIGILERIDDSTSNLLFIVKEPSGEEIFIPANNDLIIEINENDKFIKMIISDGIVELNKKA